MQNCDEKLKGLTMIFIVLCSLIAAYNKIYFFYNTFPIFVYCVINYLLIEYHFHTEFSDQKFDKYNENILCFTIIYTH